MTPSLTYSTYRYDLVKTSQKQKWKNEVRAEIRVPVPNTENTVMNSFVGKLINIVSWFPPPGEGGALKHFFGRVCAARDSKLALRSRKNFP